MGELKEKRIGFEIKKTANLIKTKFSEAVQTAFETCESDDINEQCCWILGYLYRHGNSIVCQKDLEKAFCVGRATMSKMLTNLEGREYIERKPVEGDKRLHQITLTEKGLVQEARVKESIIKFDEKLKSVLTIDERNQLFSILDKLTLSLREEKND